MTNFHSNIIAGSSILAVILIAINLTPVSNQSDFDSVLDQIKQIENKMDKNSTFFSDQLTNIKNDFQDRATDLELRMSGMRPTDLPLTGMNINKDLQKAKEQLSKLNQKIDIANQTVINRISSNNVSTDIKIKPTNAELAVKESNSQVQQMAFFDNIIENEAHDPDWSTATEDRVKNSLNITDSKLSVQNIVCGSTMCRLEANINSDDPTDVFHSFDEQIGWEGQMYMTINPETNRTVAYLGREGVALQNIQEN